MANTTSTLLPVDTAPTRRVTAPSYALLAVVAGALGFVGTRVTSYVSSLSLAPRIAPLPA